jgi:hypothetical protein
LFCVDVVPRSHKGCGWPTGLDRGGEHTRPGVPDRHPAAGRPFPIRTELCGGADGLAWRARRPPLHRGGSAPRPK